MLAFANTRGGRLIFGFDDDGKPVGLSRDKVQSLGSQIANWASDSFPYSGIGSGVRRVKELCGDRVQFENDVVGNQFKVTFLREEVNL